MQDQEEIKTVLFIQPWKVFAIEAFLFCLTFGLGIVAAFRINEIFKMEKIEIPQISFWNFLLLFLLATLFILLLSHFVKFKEGKRIIFKGLFIFISWWAGTIILSLWIPQLMAPILMGILVFWWFKKPLVLNHNLCLVLGIAGVGSTLGLSFTPLMMVALLIIFSIYDFIAVYKTKHMIKMAKEMIEAGAILALIVPPKISNFLVDLREIKPGGKFLILGGGDIAFPLLFCVSLVSEGILNSLIVAIFALFGLAVSFWFFISQKVRQPIPALPPIAFCSIIGYLITLII